MRSLKQLWIVFSLVILVSCTMGQASAPATVPAGTRAPTAVAVAVSPTAGATLSPTSPVVEPTDAQSPTSPLPTPKSAGLDFDAFLDQSFLQLLLRDPEAVTQLGLARSFGVGNDRLTDISDGYLRETQALETATLEQLRRYDREALTSEQRISADIYDWYLDDRVRGHPFLYADYPINPTVLSFQQGFLLFFTDLRSVATRQDAEDYVTCLGQVGAKFEQLLAGLQEREKAGVILPEMFCYPIISELTQIDDAEPQSTPYYTAFADKVQALDGVSEADKEALLAAAEQEIAQTVIPAYRTLLDYMKELEKKAPAEPGLWQVPNGDAYYAYLLRHYTTTEMSADEIHELGLRELDRIHAEMRAIFDELGYPQDEDLVRLYNRVAKDGGVVYGDNIVALYNTVIADAEERVANVFDLLPKAKVIVVPGPTGGYYVAPAVDGSRPGAFYAADYGAEYRYAMAPLAYHEAVPGHHYQLALAQELDLPMFRKGADFTGYVEGWALYAERLAWELGFYENDPYGNLGRLQYEALRAARLVADTGINAKHWTYKQAVDFMIENTGRSEGSIQAEVTRYSVVPGQATAYYVGYMKILELRQRAQDVLGDKFDFKEFHNVILGSGAVPLDVLEQIVDQYIQAKVG